MNKKGFTSIGFLTFIIIIAMIFIVIFPAIEGDSLESKFAIIKQNVLNLANKVSSYFSSPENEQINVDNDMASLTQDNKVSPVKTGTPVKTSNSSSASNSEASQNITVKADMIVNTVSSMKSNSSIKKGMKVYTEGFYAKGDGGSAYYTIIEDTSSVNDITYIKLNNGLVAKLILEDNMNVKQFGAKGDGEKEDTPFINEALKNASFRTLYIPSGTYMVGRLDTYSDSTIIGDGESSLFKALPGMPVGSTIFMTKGKSNITFKKIAVSGNIEFNTRDNGHSATDGIHIFDIWSSSNIKIEECIFKDNVYAAIRIVGATNLSIINSKFINVDCGIIALGSANISDMLIEGNYFEGHYNSEPISLYGTGTYTNIVINKNIIKNKTYAVGIYLARGTISNIKVTNNQIYDVAAGIVVSNASNVTIQNNIINNSGNLHNKGGSGLIISNSKNVGVRGNEISNIEQDCLQVRNSTSVDLYENIVKDCGYANDNFVFVRFDGNNDSVKFYNNNILRSDDTLYKWVLFASGNQNTQIYNNKIQNGGIYLWPNSSNYVVKNNGTDMLMNKGSGNILIK